MVRHSFSFYLSLIAILGLFATTSASTLLGQPTTADSSKATENDEPIHLHTQLTLKTPPRAPSYSFRGSVVLEPQDVGKTVVIALDIINSTEELLTYTKAMTSSSYVTFELSAEEFPPGATVSAVMKAKVENGDEEGNNKFAVRFTDESGNGIGSISCIVPAKNRLFFSDSSYGVLDIDEGIVEYKTPIIFSDPIQLENLSVAMAEDAFDKVEITTSLEKNEKHSALLVLRLDSDSLTDAVSAGKIKVIDSASSKTAEKTFFLRRQLPVEVLPTELQFVDTKEDDSVRATAIVRASPQKKPEEKEQESKKKGPRIKDGSPKLSIAVSSKGTRLPVKVVQLGSGLARVTIEISSKESKQLHAIDWDIKVDGITYRYQTKVNLPK